MRPVPGPKPEYILSSSKIRNASMTPPTKVGWTESKGAWREQPEPPAGGEKGSGIPVKKYRNSVGLENENLRRGSKLDKVGAPHVSKLCPPSSRNKPIGFKESGSIKDELAVKEHVKNGGGFRQRIENSRSIKSAVIARASTPTRSSGPNRSSESTRSSTPTRSSGSTRSNTPTRSNGIGRSSEVTKKPLVTPRTSSLVRTASAKRSNLGSAPGSKLATPGIAKTRTGVR